MKKYAFNSWFTLAEIYRWSNRYQIDAYIVYCRTLGYEIFRSNPRDGWKVVDNKEFEKKLDSGYLSVLSRMEKYRWNAERTIAGLRRGKKRDNIHLIHNLIMPYNELKVKEAKQKKKDENVIMNMFYILELGGYKIFKRINS